MIYVVEVQDESEPQAWFAFDGADFLRKVAAGDDKAAHEIWDEASARELLNVFDETPDSDGVASRWPGICALGHDLGWDTPLFRADYIQTPGLYGRQAIGVVEAGAAALRARGGQWRIYAGEPQALHAVDAPDPLFDRAGGWRARWALREQLIAVEALADNT